MNSSAELVDSNHKNYSLNHEDMLLLIHEPEWKSILLDLIDSERMDPWSLDLIMLADRYLQKINSMQENNLRIPANAILALAILLRAKSKLLRLSSIEEEEQKKEMQKFFEEFIPELKMPRNLREGKISLDELVEAIQSIIEHSKRKEIKLREKKLLEFIIPFSQENLDERINELYARILQNADSSGLIIFSSLLQGNKPEETVDTVIPLLFLANAGKVLLLQEEWFGEIVISILKDFNSAKVD
ncbi:MAG: segregation/condensation protein A [Candidatus Diapherotrites archaeon]